MSRRGYAYYAFRRSCMQALFHLHRPKRIKAALAALFHPRGALHDELDCLHLSGTTPVRAVLLTVVRQSGGFRFPSCVSGVSGVTLRAPESSYQPERLRVAVKSTVYAFVVDSMLEADEAYMIEKRGQYTSIGAYLAGDEIIKIAQQPDVSMIHPGSG